MSVANALTLMLDFGGFVLLLISTIVVIVQAIGSNQKRP